jgi:hypothetical protein
MSDLVNDWLGEYDDFVPPTVGQRGWDFGDFEADDEISRMFNFGAWGGIRPYEFSPDNPFADHPAPLLRGIELFDAGELSDAILAFEAAAQRDMQAHPTPTPTPTHPLSLSAPGRPWAHISHSANPFLGRILRVRADTQPPRARVATGDDGADGDDG